MPADVLVPYRLQSQGAGRWCALGFGIVHADLDAFAFMAGATGFDHMQTNPEVNAGVGVMHQLTRWFGSRVGARDLHAFVAFVHESFTSGG